MRKLPATSTLLSAMILAGCATLPEGYRAQHAASDTLEFASTHHHAASAEVAISPGAGLPELLRIARHNNPGLAAAFHRWKAALEKVPQSTRLPEPRLTLGAYLSGVETRVGPMQARVGIAQPLPWIGKLDLAGKAAFATAEAARESLEAARLDLEQQIREAWYDYVWLEQAIDINRGNSELLAHWESVARARLETGLGRHSDVIRAQVELGKLEDQVQTLRDLRHPLRARLNAALNRPAGADLPDPDLPRPAFPLPDTPKLKESPLRSALSEASPALKALRHRIQAAEFRTALAGKAFYPDLLIGTDYTFIGSADSPGTSGSGDDAVALTVGLDLPIRRSSYRAGVREAQAMREALRNEHRETFNRLSADLEMALYRFRDGSRRARLFRDSLIPKGEQSVRSLDAAYQSGGGGFLDLIDAERVLLEFQLQAARAEKDRARALGEIERITGLNLHPETPDLHPEE